MKSRIPRDFQVYENLITMSVENPGKGRDVKQDIYVKGDLNILAIAMAENMHRHPELYGTVIRALDVYNDPETNALRKSKKETE